MAEPRPCLVCSADVPPTRPAALCNEHHAAWTDYYRERVANWEYSLSIRDWARIMRVERKAAESG